MKNGPFAYVFPVENGDILSLCQFTRGYVVVNALRANLAGIFLRASHHPSQVGWNLATSNPGCGFSDMVVFHPPRPKKKKTLGEISPK